MELKQVIVVRTDLKMGKGKIAAQVAHASLGAALKASKRIVRKWLEENGKKVVLKAENGRKLVRIRKKAESLGLPTFLVRDAGLTQLRRGTITAVGIGPADSKKIDKITGNLKLL